MYQGVPPNPDPTFVKKLKEFDDTLECRFDRGLERFIILKHRAAGHPRCIWFIREEDGGFRQPDERDILVLWKADLWRHGGTMARILEGEKYMREYREMEDRKIREELRDVTKDNKYNLRRTMRRANNDGKAAYEYRNVQPRDRGFTIHDLRKMRAEQSKSD